MTSRLERLKAEQAERQRQRETGTAPRRTLRGYLRGLVALLALVAIVLVLLAVIGLALWAIALSWQAILAALFAIAVIVFASLVWQRVRGEA